MAPDNAVAANGATRALDRARGAAYISAINTEEASGLQRSVIKSDK